MGTLETLCRPGTGTTLPLFPVFTSPYLASYVSVRHCYSGDSGQKGYVLLPRSAIPPLAHHTSVYLFLRSVLTPEAVFPVNKE